MTYLQTLAVVAPPWMLGVIFGWIYRGKQVKDLRLDLSESEQEVQNLEHLVPFLDPERR